MTTLQKFQSDASISSTGSDLPGFGGSQEETDRIIDQIKADQQYFRMNFEQFKDEINSEDTPLFELADNSTVDKDIIKRLVIREENYEKWANIAEFLLERNRGLISTLEISAKQFNRTNEECTKLRDNVEYLNG